VFAGLRADRLYRFFTETTISGLSQFSYGVYAMFTGVWALSTVDASLISVDSMTRRRAET